LDPIRASTPHSTSGGFSTGLPGLPLQRTTFTREERMNKLANLFHLVALSLLAISGVVAAQEALPVASHPMIGEMAPGFTLSTITGDSLSLADLQGKYIVIHFGASW
jgi:hypothetical protein